ncbi:16S rRNA (uracil(1498)-N(3))-methyltransferase [Rickettsiella grylli]|uniref:16S rRNA (uracil(1498)-N(3))-methyltransferase n=1 Tax=Rickettsiella grylli TaxID=59196 RepID=UPI0008FCE8D1|nr:16S rRNA (uracil(1498)-N(3))-methyltransferase [Rickettsiella grylli]OIZ99691.1 16S rRNA (uracil(1498)-N(3))-methyltransferase [Rickettsiella grylli]
MRLTRIYQAHALNTGQIISLSQEAAHHLIRVLRLQVGDECIIFNGQAGEFQATIIERIKTTARVKLGEFNAINRESPLQITLVQAILHSDKMDYLLQKAVELGVTHVIPLLTAHSTLKLTPDRWGKRYVHWQGVMRGACEQSGRTRIPTLENPMTFDVAMMALKAETRIILQPAAKKMLHSLPFCQRVVLCIGPEGGWSLNELDSAQKMGFQAMKMGPRVLRSETAGVVAMSLLQGLYGDL